MPENKIYVSKLKINRPKISFNFFQKENFGGWTLWKGEGGGSGRSVQRMLSMKKIDLRVFPFIQKVFQATKYSPNLAFIKILEFKSNM